MIIIKAGIRPSRERPWWTMQIATCPNCRTEFRLEESDIVVPAPKDADLVLWSCPTCPNTVHIHKLQAADLLLRFVAIAQSNGHPRSYSGSTPLCLIDRHSALWVRLMDTASWDCDDNAARILAAHVVRRLAKEPVVVSPAYDDDSCVCFVLDDGELMRDVKAIAGLLRDPIVCTRRLYDGLLREAVARLLLPNAKLTALPDEQNKPPTT